MPSTYLCLNVHIVFSTKNRAPFLQPDIIERVHDYLGGTARGLGAIVVRIGGVEDHVHLLLKLRGTHSTSSLVREIKKACTGWIQEFVPGFSWQEGYGAFSVSQERMKGVENYIENQAEHHRTMDFREELIMLYRLAEIEFDPTDLD